MTRRVACAAATSDTAEYKISQFGLDRNVQWLHRAADSSMWLILATKRSASEPFMALGSQDVTSFPPDSVKQYFQATCQQAAGPTVTFTAGATPSKRKQEVLSLLPTPTRAPTAAFSSRAVLPRLN